MAEKQFPTDFSQISDIVDATTILVDDGSSNQYATAEQIQNYIETKSLVMSTGVFTVGNGTGSAQVRCDGAAGNGRYTTVRTNGITRWLYGGGSSAESGSDAGTPWHILAYDDAGDFIDTPISVTRASGGSITFNRRLQMSGKNINDVGSIEVGGDVVLNSSLPRLRMEDTDGTKATWLIQTGNELEIQRRNLSDGAYEAVALDINHDNEKIASNYDLDLNDNDLIDAGDITASGQIQSEAQGYGPTSSFLAKSVGPSFGLWNDDAANLEGVWSIEARDDGSLAFLAVDPTYYSTQDFLRFYRQDLDVNHTDLLSNLDLNGNNLIDVGDITSSGMIKSTNSSISESTPGSFLAEAGVPAYAWHETDADTDEGRWDISCGSGVLRFRAVNDAVSSANGFLQINRSGASVTSAAWTCDLDLNGNNITDVGIIFGPGSDDFVILAAENAAGASRIGAYGSTHASFADHVLYSSDNHLFNTATGTNIVEMYSDQCKLSAETKLSITGDDADPPSLSDGDIWHRTDLDELRIRLDGTTYSFDLTAV